MNSELRAAVSGQQCGRIRRSVVRGSTSVRQWEDWPQSVDRSRFTIPVHCSLPTVTVHCPLFTVHCPLSLPARRRMNQLRSQRAQTLPEDLPHRVRHSIPRRRSRHGWQAAPAVSSAESPATARSTKITRGRRRQAFNPLLHALPVRAGQHVLQFFARNPRRIQVVVLDAGRSMLQTLRRRQASWISLGKQFNRRRTKRLPAAPARFRSVADRGNICVASPPSPPARCCLRPRPPASTPCCTARLQSVSSISSMPSRASIDRGFILRLAVQQAAHLSSKTLGSSRNRLLGNQAVLLASFA